MRMLFEEYEVTGDAKILEAIEKHYQAVYKKEERFNLPKDAGFSIRSLLHIKHLCKLSGITNNKWYLEIAKKLYSKFQKNASSSNNKELLRLTAQGMTEGMIPTNARKPNDKVKSLSQCLQGLIYSAGGDGNFLFNVVPDSLHVLCARNIIMLTGLTLIFTWI